MEQCLRSARPGPLDQCLVVEDDSIIRLDLEETLKGFGFRHVHGASSLEAAVTIIGAAPICFAVLDYNVGTSNTARGVPALFLTAYGAAVELPPSLSHLEVLSKPFSSEVLADAMLRVLKLETAPPAGDACEGGCQV